jgi:hypothetical protein
VSLLSFMQHRSASFAAACSNDQAAPTVVTILRACSVNERLPTPAQASNGTALARHARQA